MFPCNEDRHERVLNLARNVPMERKWNNISFYRRNVPMERRQTHGFLFHPRNIPKEEKRRERTFNSTHETFLWNEKRI